MSGRPFLLHQDGDRSHNWRSQAISRIENFPCPGQPHCLCLRFREDAAGSSFGSRAEAIMRKIDDVFGSWCSFNFQWLAIGSGLWETVAMTSARKLEFHKSAQFTGWACTACGWAKPIPRLVESGGNLPKDIETDFANHDCAKHPCERNSKV